MISFRKMMSLTLAAAACLTLTACMNREADAPQSTVRTEYVPEATAQPARTEMPASTQAPVAFDWVTGSGQIEANVSRLSEISDCRVVVTGDTALVAVKFTPTYQGEVTQRIQQMVAAEVQKADPAIQTVAVTAEEADVAEVYQIADRLQAGETPETQSAKIREIAEKPTTLR